MTRKFYIHKPFEIFMLNVFIFQVKQIMEEAVTRKFYICIPFEIFMLNIFLFR